jgi:hypothetical protein
MYVQSIASDWIVFHRPHDHPPPPRNRLEGDNTNTSALSNNVANASSRVSRVSIRSLVRSLLGDLSSAVGVEVTRLRGEALLLRVEVGNDSAIGVGERGLLDEDLSAHTRVDTGNTAAVAGAVDVAGAKTDRGQTGVDVDEGVVVVGHTELAGVLSSVAVAVANE